MKHLFFVFMTLLVGSSSVSGQSITTHYELPVPAGRSAPSDSSLKNLVWNKWDTTNFTILSLDQSQGKYLFDNVERMKEWSLRRWGLPEKFRFTAPCKVLCVPNKDLMKKLFRLEESYAEVRIEDGKIKESVLWLVLDKPTPAEIIPSALTVVCLREFEQVHNSKVGFWAHRGISMLNNTPSQIGTNISSLQTSLNYDQQMFFGKGLFGMTEGNWSKLEADKRDLFDKECVALCLLIRKEFGQENFWELATTDGSEQSLNSVLGFQGYAQFDSTLKRYMQNLAIDVTNNRTPVAYLQISPPKSK